MNKIYCIIINFSDAEQSLFVYQQTYQRYCLQMLNDMKSKEQEQVSCTIISITLQKIIIFWQLIFGSRYLYNLNEYK